MMNILSVDVEWLVLLVNAYSPSTQAVAGPDSVPQDRANGRQPSLAADVTSESKRALAERMWLVFGASTTDERIAALESLLARSALSPHVDAQARVTWSTNLVRPTDVLTARCAATLLEAVTTHGWARLGTCAGCACVDVYVDRAGRTPRKYCTGVCLNRARVRAFRARQATP